MKLTDYILLVVHVFGRNKNNNYVTFEEDHGYGPSFRPLPTLLAMILSFAISSSAFAVKYRNVYMTVDLG